MGCFNMQPCLSVLAQRELDNCPFDFRRNTTNGNDGVEGFLIALSFPETKANARSGTDAPLEVK